MAASLDMTDPVTLAHQILASTTEQRLALLRTFYVGQNPALEQLFTLPEKERIAAPKQKVLRARGQREPARGRGKQGEPSKDKDSLVIVMYRILSVVFNV